MRFLLVICFVLLSCSSDDDLLRKPPELELKEALEFYQNEDYNDARISFGTLSIRYSGTKVGEQSLFYLAETYFKLQKYLLAADTYKSLYERYSNSEYLEKAYFNEAKSYEMLSPVYVLDQKYTVSAINKYKEFLLEYPGTSLKEDVEKQIYDLNDKLAQKQYHSAYIYFRMEKWRPTINYIDMLIEKHPDSSVIKDAYLLKVLVHIEKEEWIVAEQMLELTLSKFPEIKVSDEKITEIKMQIDEGKKSRLDG